MGKVSPLQFTGETVPNHQVRFGTPVFVWKRIDNVKIADKYTFLFFFVNLFFVKGPSHVENELGIRFLYQHLNKQTPYRLKIGSETVKKQVTREVKEH